MSKKKFNETKVGEFIKNKAPQLLDILSGILPDLGGLGVVKRLISKDKSIPVKDKETALKLLEQDMVEMQEVTKRWDSDMKSDSWLSKNTRPLSLVFLTVMAVALIWVDSVENTPFTVSAGWVNLLQTLLTTVYIAYFGSRGAEKWKNIGNNK
tara:strand:+ start:2298 stop:2756 length:459 start_codon:yes stop_codon:yes gene_type:complete